MTSAPGEPALARRDPPPPEAIRRWPAAGVRNWVTAFLERARRDPNIAAVVAIGSAVRPGVDSDDLDLIVCCHDTALLKERAPIEVDLRCKNVLDVDRDIAKRGDLMIWAVRFGEPLLDKDHTWQAVVRRWEGHLPLPDPAVSLKRANALRPHMETMRAAGDQDAFNELNLSYLSHHARAVLAAAGIHPASRPELPGQLRELGDTALAARLEAALAKR